MLSKWGGDLQLRRCLDSRNQTCLVYLEACDSPSLEDRVAVIGLLKEFPGCFRLVSPLLESSDAA